MNDRPSVQAEGVPTLQPQSLPGAKSPSTNAIHLRAAEGVLVLYHLLRALWGAQRQPCAEASPESRWHGQPCVLPSGLDAKSSLRFPVSCAHTCEGSPATSAHEPFPSRTGWLPGTRRAAGRKTPGVFACFPRGSAHLPIVVRPALPDHRCPLPCWASRACQGSRQ